MPRKIDSAAERANLMLALLSYLKRSKLEKDVTAGELATHFNVELKEIDRALRKLNLSGYKDVFDSSETEMNPYFVPFDFDEDDDSVIPLKETDVIDLEVNSDARIKDAPQFTGEQVSALITGLQYLRTLPDDSANDDITELIKILSEGRAGIFAENIEYRSTTKTQTIEALQRAIREHRRIKCSYQNQEGSVTVREMDPLRIDPRASAWQLRAWCHVHNSLRNFRVDTMSNVEVLEQVWVPEAETAVIADEADYIAKESDVEVIVEVDPEGYALVSDFGGKAHKQSKAETKDGTIKATLKIGYLPYFGRAVARFGGAVRVISPQAAKDAVREYALAAIGQASAGTEVE
ncbi:MAG: helix-turn-helix transcriptional regulator [Micrococcales bacterium]